MKVRLTRRAHAELADALDYIAQDSPRRAARVVRRIEDILRLLSEFPELGRPGGIPDTRQIPVTRTPYILVYRIGQQIEVISILHGRQKRPGLSAAP